MKNTKETHSHTYNMCDMNGRTIASITSVYDSHTLLKRAFMHDDLVNALKNVRRIAAEHYTTYNDIEEALRKAGEL